MANIQPPYNQNQQVIYVERKRSNGFGVAGFVLAVLGLVFCWVPVMDWILWALGFIFSLIGLFKAPRGLAIAGLIISFIGMILLVVMLGLLAGAVAGAVALQS